LRTLLRLPYVVGADWFQYYDEPPFGRHDGENYNFGLVDIHDRPYRELTAAATRFDPPALKARGATARPDASSGVPRAPKSPLANFKPMLALKHWDRERGFVKPTTDFPMADLYLCWDKNAVYVGLYAQDVVEEDFYRDKAVLEADRAEWTVSLDSVTAPIRARIGAGLEPAVSAPGVGVVNLSGKPGVKIVISSGVNLNTRNIAAMVLPATLFDREHFRVGDRIRLSSTFRSHGRSYRTEWDGEFKLAD